MASTQVGLRQQPEPDHDAARPVPGPPAPGQRHGGRRLPDPFVRRGLVTLGVLTGLLVVVIGQVATGTGLVRLDIVAHGLYLENRWTDTWVVMKTLEVLGQRGPTAVEAFLIVGWIAWRQRMWRPVVVLSGSLLALNLVVGAMKLTLARDKPSSGVVELFTDGMMFPSGHAGNAVLTWAIVGYLISRYAGVRNPRRWLKGTAIATVLVALVVGIASVYYDSHWVTDLVAGWIVGAMVLQAAILVDQWIDRRQAAVLAERVVQLADRARGRGRGLESG